MPAWRDWSGASLSGQTAGSKAAKELRRSADIPLSCWRAALRLATLKAYRIHRSTRKESPMPLLRPARWLTFSVTALALAWTGAADAACCYFSAKDADILQPAQKAFITWDAEKKVESFTVQPKFEGNALDFGMVIPTP